MDHSIHIPDPAHRAVLESCRPLVGHFVADRAIRKNVVVDEGPSDDIVRFAEGMLHGWLRSDCLTMEAMEEWQAHFAGTDAASVHAQSQDGSSIVLATMGRIDNLVSYGIDYLVAPGIYRAVLRGMGRSVTPLEVTTCAPRMLEACYRQVGTRFPELANVRLPYLRWPDLLGCEIVGKQHENSPLGLLPSAVAAMIMPYMVAA